MSYENDSRLSDVGLMHYMAICPFQYRGSPARVSGVGRVPSSMIMDLIIATVHEVSVQAPHTASPHRREVSDLVRIEAAVTSR